MTTNPSDRERGRQVIRYGFLCEASDDVADRPLQVIRNGIVYEIAVDQAECDRRIGHLLATLCRPRLAGRAGISPSRVRISEK